MVASPVMPVYPPMMYPMRGPVTTLPSPVASGVPLYPCEIISSVCECEARMA